MRSELLMSLSTDHSFICLISPHFPYRTACFTILWANNIYNSRVFFVLFSVCIYTFLLSYCQWIYLPPAVVLVGTRATLIKLLSCTAYSHMRARSAGAHEYIAYRDPMKTVVPVLLDYVSLLLYQKLLCRNVISMREWLQTLIMEFYKFHTVALICRKCRHKRGWI